jgi:hypothetical protein
MASPHTARPAENDNTARSGGGAAEKIQGDIKPFSDSKRHAVSQADIRHLGRYRSARDALNASLALLGGAIDIREQLRFGLDMDDMRAEVAAFNRACEQHKARRMAP